jgi:hypothetical protein
MAIKTTKKTPQMVENEGSNPPTFRYYTDPAAHLMQQTAFTKTGVLNMLNRKPPRKKNRIPTGNGTNRMSPNETLI